MNAVLENPTAANADFYASQLKTSLDQACQRIAPTWPLDQFIAVNPYWGFVDHPIADAAKQLAHLSGTPLVMPRSFYRQQWQAGHLTQAHLQTAIDAAQMDCKIDELIGSLAANTKGAPPLTLGIQLADSQRDLSHNLRWVDFVTHQISQHCAAY